MTYIYKSPKNWADKINILKVKKDNIIKRAIEVQKEIDFYQEKIDNFPYKNLL